MILPIIHVVLALVLAPLLLGVINRTKACFAGRTGQPLLQVYYDLGKLARKGATYSRTTTWVFRAGPIVGLSATVLTLGMLPLAGQPGLLSFAGDFLLMAYLLGLARFFTISAALDTGSAFEGMGASREGWFGALGEPALLLGLAALSAETGSLSLSGIFTGEVMWASHWVHTGPTMLLVAAALGILFLSENCRIPVDDPNTHLELTMIHEVMVLDHGGVDFAFIQYGSALKHWLLGALVINTAVPFYPGNPAASLALVLGGLFVLGIGVGVVESAMARLRLTHVPHLLVAATAMTVLALVIVLR